MSVTASYSWMKNLPPALDHRSVRFFGADWRWRFSQIQYYVNAQALGALLDPLASALLSKIGAPAEGGSGTGYDLCPQRLHDLWCAFMLSKPARMMMDKNGKLKLTAWRFGVKYVAYRLEKP
jgi:hypothetical protein